MKKEIIKVNGIRKSYNTLEVLKDVSFKVNKGEIFALLGSNGAGKTTIIKILCTLIKADAGVITINENDIVEDSLQIRNQISLTGQFSALDEILTGRENLELIAKLRHLQNPKEEANRLLKQFQLEDAAQRRVATYSGGMKRRLDIAMSLLGNPSIIFLDEPTIGLDPQSRIEVWKEIKQLAKQGITIFLTTQYLDEAEQLADQIAILNNGEIVIQETLENLKQKFQPTKKEYVEKQRSLEDIFLALVNKEGEQ